MFKQARVPTAREGVNAVENEVSDRRISSATESMQASDTLEMLTRMVEPTPGERTLKVRLPPIFVILPGLSLVDN